MPVWKTVSPATLRAAPKEKPWNTEPSSRIRRAGLRAMAANEHVGEKERPGSWQTAAPTRAARAQAPKGARRGPVAGSRRAAPSHTLCSCSTQDPRKTGPHRRARPATSPRTQARTYQTCAHQWCCDANAAGALWSARGNPRARFLFAARFFSVSFFFGAKAFEVAAREKARESQNGTKDFPGAKI